MYIQVEVPTSSKVLQYVDCNHYKCTTQGFVPRWIFIYRFRYLLILRASLSSRQERVPTYLSYVWVRM